MLLAAINVIMDMVTHVFANPLTLSILGGASYVMTSLALLRTHSIFIHRFTKRFLMLLFVILPIFFFIIIQITDLLGFDMVIAVNSIMLIPYIFSLVCMTLQKAKEISNKFSFLSLLLMIVYASFLGLVLSAFDNQIAKIFHYQSRLSLENLYHIFIIIAVAIGLTWAFGIIKDIIDRLIIENTTDSLTGINNRKYFFEEGHKIYDNSKSCCMVMYDLDDFKDINDNHGHDIGDEALCHVVNIVSESLTDNILHARLGGGRIYSINL